jgi:hypothetical protein
MNKSINASPAPPKKGLAAEGPPINSVAVFSALLKNHLTAE